MGGVVRKIGRCGMGGIDMYGIDTAAIAFMFNEGSSWASTIHPIDIKIGILYIFVIRASDVVLPIFAIYKIQDSKLFIVHQ